MKSLGASYQIALVVLMFVIVVLASWLGSINYSRGACMATTNTVSCSHVEAK